MLNYRESQLISIVHYHVTVTMPILRTGLTGISPSPKRNLRRGFLRLHWRTRTTSQTPFPIRKAFLFFSSFPSCSPIPIVPSPIHPPSLPSPNYAPYHKVLLQRCCRLFRPGREMTPSAAYLAACHRCISTRPSISGRFSGFRTARCCLPRTSLVEPCIHCEISGIKAGE